MATKEAPKGKFFKIDVEVEENKFCEFLEATTCISGVKIGELYLFDRARKGFDGFLAFFH